MYFNGQENDRFSYVKQVPFAGGHLWDKNDPRVLTHDRTTHLQQSNLKTMWAKIWASSAGGTSAHHGRSGGAIRKTRLSFLLFYSQKQDQGGLEVVAA